MKTIKTLSIVLLCIATTLTISCKKDKTNPLKQRQAVLDSIDRDFTMEISNGSPGAYAVGYDFSVTEKGIINQIEFTTPSVGVYKVVIQNITTSVKDSVSFNYAIADSGKISFESIAPMIANAGDNFRITFNDLDKPQYQYLRTNGMTQFYGNIHLTHYIYQAQTTSSTIIGNTLGSSVNYTFGAVGCVYEKD